MGIGIASEEQHLEKEHAGGTDCGCYSEPGQYKLTQQGLNQEEKEGAQKQRGTVENHKPSPRSNLALIDRATGTLSSSEARCQEQEARIESRTDSVRLVKHGSQLMH